MINQRTAALIILSCFIIYTFYYNFHENLITIENFDVSEKISRREHIYVYNGTEDFLINTKGCYIPNYLKTLEIKEPRIYNKLCGNRAVFIKKIEDFRVEFIINKNAMDKYKKSLDTQCYYNFASRSNKTGQEDTKLSYTQWIPFQTGTKATLEQEIITVKCNATVEKESHTTYEDVYVFVKKLETKKPKTKEKTWNVLLVGMDTMSRARVFSSMPRLVQYFQENGWLDYRGYQKVGYNTFPNLMAVLTGKKMDTVYRKCTKSMSKCNDFFIWSRFRDDGYITAYGEDSLRLPDTFSRYHGFQIQPTHHYLRPFFLTGEIERGNVQCAKHRPSAAHLLDYAAEFANTYKTAKFFGAFWINSYSHNLNHVPTLLDNDMVGFFEKLNKSGVLNNTMVIFTSDHGTRYGNMRVPMESFYDERLPMLFMWVPHDFRQLHEDKYYNLQLNQNRLVTPYDLYLTMEELRNKLRKSEIESEACPQCTSFFEKKSVLRTCADAGVSKKWCSCHAMTVPRDASEAEKSLKLAVKYIQDVASSVNTVKCKMCRPLKLKDVLRTHSYVDRSDNNTHYVVAWQMAPGSVSFEATVMREGNNFTIVQPTHTISEYNKLGNCVKNPNDRQFCVCKAIPNCT